MHLSFYCQYKTKEIYSDIFKNLSVFAMQQTIDIDSYM